MRDLLPAWIDIHHCEPGQQLEGRVLLDEAQDWPAASTSVDVQLGFGRSGGGRLTLHGHLRGIAQMQCQRCLDQMPVEFEGDFELEVVRSEAEAERASSPLDVYVAQDNKIQLRELVREEAILALPMQARHPAGACSPPGGQMA